MTETAVNRFQALLPWVAAVAGIVITGWIFYPGYLSFDSAYQWWQARHQVVDTSHPPVMTWIWGLTDRLVSGPGGYFLFQLGVYWLSLCLFVSCLRLSVFWRAALVLILGFWPPLWGLSWHLWKDVGTLSFFCLAGACYARDLLRPHGAWRAIAFASIVLACMYRHNALTAALPFMVYGVMRHFSLRPSRPQPGTFRVLLYSGLACVVIQGLVVLPNHLLKLHSEPQWTVLALWDIAAVSLQEDRLLFPPEWVAHDMTMDDLRRDFSPVFSGIMFRGSKVRLIPYSPTSDEDFNKLRKTWLLLPVRYPQAYWRHRFGVMQTLLGWRHDPANASLVFHTRVTSYKDNPPLTPRPIEARSRLEKIANKYNRGVLFQGGSYLLLSFLILGVAIHRRNALMGALAASGLMYALPLLLLAPSADFRYLGWMLQATLLAGFAVFIAPSGAITPKGVAIKPPG